MTAPHVGHFFRKHFLIAAGLVASLMLGGVTNAQTYSESFDADASANWTTNPAGNDFSESTIGDGITDFTADYFYDYSLAGIPSAPNSTGGTTRGLKIQANLLDGEFGGGSVSPTGKSFTGDYSLKFDLWSNFYLADGSQTNLSTYGVMTNGTVPVYPGTGDGVWFGATTDGGSGSDYRAYSVERNVSYQLPVDEAVLDGQGNPVDGHATYHGGSRNGSASLYSDAFPSTTILTSHSTVDRETTVGDGVIDGNPDGNADFPLQVGDTDAGDLGMSWRAVEIRKVGETVSWIIDGVALVDIDTTNFTTAPTGSNIFFGHSDINAGSSGDLISIDLLFTLIDNVEVSPFVASALACDSDSDKDCELNDIDAMYAESGNAGAFDLDGTGTVGPEDITFWLAAASTAANVANTTGDTYKIGDVNLDGNVDSTDLGAMLNNFGSTAATPADGVGWGGGDLDMNGTVDSTDLGALLNEFGFASASAAAVPEPTSATLFLAAILGLAGLRRRR